MLGNGSLTLILSTNLFFRVVQTLILNNMKTIEEIKDKIAHQHGYKDFMDVLKSFDCAKSTYTEVNFIINEAIQEYAKQCCEEQKKACWKNADVHYDESGMMDNYIRTDCVAVDKDSILNTPNVVK